MGAAVSIEIEDRFNGPLSSGNGGYCSGVLAGLLDGVAEVRLRRPVPLDAPLDVEWAADGSVRALEGETLVAEAREIPSLDLEVPSPPVGLEEARRAMTGYRGLADGMFSRCFVCGRAREDAFGVFPGPVEGRRLVASTWTPPGWSADEEGDVRPEFVWATLDCPTYFALYTEGELPPSVLAQMAARIDAPVRAGEEHVVVAWPLESEGRKRFAGSAVLDRDGAPLALARALLIEPRREEGCG